MLNKMSMLLATAAAVLCVGTASADPYNQGPANNDQRATGDQNQPAYGSGYNYGYDDGYAHRDRNDRYRPEEYRHQVHYDRGANYYGRDCENNSGAGTVLGAIAGGLIGGAVSHGNGGAVVGGVILGGLAGNSISSDMNCNDRRYAMVSYSQGFEGRIGHRYDWSNDDGSSHGSFTPTREYSRDGNTCRDFREAGHGNGHDYNRNGTACRHSDGNWYTE